MSTLYPLNQDDYKKIKSILNKLGVYSDKVTIDLKQCTIQIDDLYDVSDLLDTRHAISKERAKELLDHIKEVREEWDHE